MLVFSLRHLCVLCVSAVSPYLHERNIDYKQFNVKIFYKSRRSSEKMFPLPKIPAGSNARFSAAISRKCSSP